MKRLTLERERRGWSRAELARRAALHPADVGKYEAGRLVPYPRQLARLAEALGWPVERAGELMDEVAEEAAAGEVAAR